LANLAHDLYHYRFGERLAFFGPKAMPIRHADTTKIATRFAFTCSIRFNLKDNSDYEKTVYKQSREKITPKKQVLK